MAGTSNTPGADPHDPRPAALRQLGVAAKNDPPAAPPSSKPLQIFLLVALVITGAAYVVDEYTDMASENLRAKLPASRQRHLAEHKADFIRDTRLGHEAEAQNKHVEAMLHFRRALLARDVPEGHVNLGNVLLKEGNTDMAFSQYKEALRQNPDYVDAYLAWGHALTIQGKLDDAAQLYLDALRHNSQWAGVHWNYAKILEQKQQAAQAAQRAAEAIGDSSGAARSAAEAQLYGSDALKQYEAAEKSSFDSPDFWAAYGTLLNKQGKYPAAEERLLRAVVEQPAQGAAQFQLALAQDHQGKYAEAIEHYEATLAAIPDDPAALNNLALIYATAANSNARSPKLAIALGLRACEATNDQNARYLDTLARAYAVDGNFVQAIDFESKAVRRAAQLNDHDELREFQPRFNLFAQHRLQ